MMTADEIKKEIEEIDKTLEENLKLQEKYPDNKGLKNNEKFLNLAKKAWEEKLNDR